MRVPQLAGLWRKPVAAKAAVRVRRETHHNGIIYFVTELEPRLWRWEVVPPTSVRGWQPASGEVAGGRTDAVAAAKAEIDRQQLEIGRANGYARSG